METLTTAPAPAGVPEQLEAQNLQPDIAMHATPETVAEASLNQAAAVKLGELATIHTDVPAEQPAGLTLKDKMLWQAVKANFAVNSVAERLQKNPRLAMAIGAAAIVGGAGLKRYMGGEHSPSILMHDAIGDVANLIGKNPTDIDSDGREDASSIINTFSGLTA